MKDLEYWIHMAINKDFSEAEKVAEISIFQH